SISTPVRQVARAVAVMVSAASPSGAMTTSTASSGRGWQSGIRSAVRLAAWMPASRAVSRTGPLGPRSGRARARVAGLMLTRAAATARRAVVGLSPTSTMRAPSGPRCDSGRLILTMVPGAGALGRRVADSSPTSGAAKPCRTLLSSPVSGPRRLPTDEDRHLPEPATMLTLLLAALISLAPVQTGELNTQLDDVLAAIDAGAGPS